MVRSSLMFIFPHQRISNRTYEITPLALVSESRRTKRSLANWNNTYSYSRLSGCLYTNCNNFNPLIIKMRINVHRERLAVCAEQKSEVRDVVVVWMFAWMVGGRYIWVCKCLCVGRLGCCDVCTPWNGDISVTEAYKLYPSAHQREGVS